MTSKGHRRSFARLAWWPLACLALSAGRPAAAQDYLPPLQEAQIAEVRATLEAMKRDARGPYLRIRWFCADGTVQPPQGAGCRERGGGVQHAEMSDAARRLGPLGFHPGTILQATSFEALLDAPHAYDRLKQLVLDQFLFEIDDGWVLRQARYYRGARQAEDEEAAGTAFLKRLLSDPRWVRDHYWLATRVVAVVPHVGVAGDMSVQRVRNLATEIAELEPDFLPLRIKIHSFPSSDDLAAVTRFARRTGLRPQAQQKLGQLRGLLAAQYDRTAHLDRLREFERRLAGAPGIAEDLAALRASIAAGDATTMLRDLGQLSSQIRRRVVSTGNGAESLLLLDLNHTLQEQALVIATARETEAEPRTRRRRVRDLSVYFELAEGAGLLSPREREALEAGINRLSEPTSLEALAYRQGLSYLTRSLEWATGTVRSYMAPALDRYVAVEPKAAGFPDAILRGSILLPLSTALGRLAADADEALGASHTLLADGGETGSAIAGIRGLNAGVARGRLELAEHEVPHEFDRTAIYVLPETTPELRPVAGVLTLDAGNLLSHIQLLARNLGIPNASIPSQALPLLREAEDREVFYAVSPLGRVVVKDTTAMTEQDRSLLAVRQEVRGQKYRLDTSRLDLTALRPIPLDELRSEDSGVLVGPKAANLGALASVFPGRVAPGLALTFGMFRRHVDRPLEDTGLTPLQELARAYETAASMRAQGRSEEDIDRFMFERLARLRTSIVELEWLPDMRARIVSEVTRIFGSDLSAGIFVRSDTNVEDLPQFSGAGLNLTLPNRRSLDDILAGIKQVWTSPFSERAYLWRKQILDDQGEVYPSVLLLRSVPSEKSGVMITSGLQNGTPDDLMIATGEGVGGAVDGEGAETILVHPNGGTTLLTQTRSPVRRILEPGGGARMVPARRPEYLLTRDEIEQLRGVVETWKRRTTDKTPGRVWDFEFGFVDGKIWLFQVRPFVRFRSSEMMDRLAALDREAMANATRRISMEEAI